MALNIKDPEVDHLAEELAGRMGHSNKTRAIRDALRAQLSVLEARSADRVTALLEVMRDEIWPLLPDAPGNHSAGSTSTSWATTPKQTSER